MAKKSAQQHSVERPPVVVIMGHIDHGKSTLLDYIRKSNTVASEAGGITQHLSAYVVDHETKEQGVKHITFLDTPGHEAFQKMRFRGADVADIAILIVSAEDGVMPQTKEALTCIEKAGIPFIVAINKIDKPGADLARTQASLIEHGIYIEGMGGNISWVAISAKSGEGISELLDVLLLTAEIAELKGDTSAPAEGVVIESNLDTKRGNTATLIVKNGTLRSGTFVVSENTYAPVRIMEDWSGKTIKEAGLSEPVRIVGFSNVPTVGAPFTSVKNKKEAERAISMQEKTNTALPVSDGTTPTVPLLIKADVFGTVDAIKHELDKFASDRIAVRIIETGVGNVTANDVQSVSATEHAIIVGFNVKVDRAAFDLAERLGVEIKTFDIIYELSEWLEGALKDRTPTKEEEQVVGSAKVLKTFSKQKKSQVLGARVLTGSLSVGQQIKILRRDVPVGGGTIVNIQQQKSDVQTVQEGEFGANIESRTDIAAGDEIQAITMVTI